MQKVVNSVKWMRYSALGIGIAFGLLFLTFAFGEGFRSIPNLQDCILLLFGPVSMIAATTVAWKHERIGGWWLITGGIITGTIFTARLIDRPTNLLWTLLVYPLPMLLAGVLWVLHEAKFAKVLK